MSVATVQLFDFRNNLTSFGKMDAITNVTPPLKLSETKKYYIQALSAELSARIPNVFSSTSPKFNNQIVHVKRNVGDLYTQLTLPLGNYTAQKIGQAIVSAIQTWFTNSADPSLVITTNSVIDKVNIQILAGKLASGGTQFCIDLKSGSDLSTTLGFSSAIFTTNGTFTSDLTPQLDTQTTTCDIICDLCTVRALNGRASKILFSIPLILANGSQTTFLFPPPGATLPLIPYNGPKVISNFSLYFRTSDDKPFYWMNGNVNVQFTICEIVSNS